MRRRLWMVIGLVVLVASCSSSTDADTATGADLPGIDRAALDVLVSSGDRPTVLNFWASWCIPCRSEAPLLVAADETWSEQVRFVGIASDDTQSGAAGFIEEFGLGFANFIDPNGSIKGTFGGTGLPLTIFIDADGEVIRRHFGVIDDAALAVGIDELLSG